MDGRYHFYFLFPTNRKISSHMAQISKHNNSSIHKVYSYDQMIKMIVHIVSKKCENSDTYLCQLTYIYNSLLMSTVDTPENNLSYVDHKYDIRKVRTSSVKTPSTLFSCSIRSMYNRVNCDQKKRLVCKSYL